MEAIIEIIFYFLGELFYAILINFPFEWIGLDGRYKDSKFFSLSLCTFLGVFVGVISLFIFKDHMITSHFLRMVYVMVAPIMIGSLFVLIHSNRNYNKDKLYLFSSFWNAYVFALSIALIRFFFIYYYQ